jgi:flagellar biosynthetic protein FlhB
MNDQDDQSDKSFEATPQKLLEARKKGEIARSAELLTAASYFGFFVALSVFGYASLMSLASIFSVYIGQAAQFAPLFFDGAATAPARALMQNVGWALAPIFGTPALAVLLVLFATRGIVFAPNKITPKMSKISVISNAKNKYGRSGLFQFLLSFSKLSIYSIVLAVFIQLRLDDMVAALHTKPYAIVATLARLGMEFLFVVVVVSAVIGGIDFIWQHFEHLRKNRMTRKEVLDETKNSEGDPHMKQERRQRAQSIAGMQMASEVAKADVIIVNPTHYAVALRWDRQKGRAPVCVAKGIDEVARRIREIAHEHAVPVHSDPPTARALHATTDIGNEIAPEHYRAVAAAIRFAEAMRLKAKGRA